MEFTLNVADAPFDLACTLESGQVFRWENREGWWYGILEQGVVKVRQEQSSLICVSSSDRIGPRYLHEYFGLDDDLPGILSSINKDSAMMEAAQRFYGLRLIRQPVWECMISFTIATNINIPRIAKTIAALSERFGEQVEFEGSRYRLFPRPGNLALAEVEALAACGLGYRTKFVKHVAQAVYEERVDFSELQMQSYEKARELLIGKVLGRKSLLGIGPKVADCVLLFSCGKDDAFPIDVWIARGLASYYPDIFDRGLKERLELKSKRRGTLSQKEYDLASGAARRHFGKYAGYAQQYLFLLSRSNHPPPDTGQS
jgi:N-glycosylase/DNA lyase